VKYRKSVKQEYMILGPIEPADRTDYKAVLPHAEELTGCGSAIDVKWQESLQVDAVWNNRCLVPWNKPGVGKVPACRLAHRGHGIGSQHRQAVYPFLSAASGFTHTVARIEQTGTQTQDGDSCVVVRDCVVGVEHINRWLGAQFSQMRYGSKVEPSSLPCAQHWNPHGPHFICKRALPKQAKHGYIVPHRMLGSHKIDNDPLQATTLERFNEMHDPQDFCTPGSPR
jgi:hypothetical protein